MRIAAAGLLALMIMVYYGGGPAFQYWPDSGSYLVQARGILGDVPYARPGDRSVGYPAFVALTLLTPAPALVLVLGQAGLTVLSFAGIYLALTRLALPRLLPEMAASRRAHDAVLLGVTAAALYSVVHVQLAALLPETLFAGLVLAAVLATLWLLLQAGSARRIWLGALPVAALIALPMLVKPHWRLAAGALSLIVMLVVWRATVGRAPRRGMRLWPGILALAPVLVTTLVALPDRLLATHFGAREAALFGPRTAFCNHAHLVALTLQRRPGLALAGDPAFEKDFRQHLARMVAAHAGGWRLLGFNGDLCTYDRDFSALLDRHFPVPAAQGRFLLGSLARAAVADPLPYAHKVLAQVGHGFLTAFARFAIHARPEPGTYATAARAYGLPERFVAGIGVAAEVGPHRSKAALDGTLAGRMIHGLLAVLFHLATGMLAGLVLATLVLPPIRWRLWSGAVRRDFLALVALPLSALLAHHALIALVHTFDVWRYGFNMFYVNLLFIGTASMFWLADWRRRRTSVACVTAISPPAASTTGSS